jgi:hypothetical protein
MLSSYVAPQSFLITGHRLVCRHFVSFGRCSTCRIGHSRIFQTKIQCNSMTARSLIGLLLAAVGMTGCSHQGQTHYRVTLISDQPWAIGEAKPCSFDGEYMEMHCFPPTPEALAAPKRDYFGIIYLTNPWVCERIVSLELS